MAQRRRRKKRSSDDGSKHLRCTVLLEPRTLEVARGHDGPLRGHPEPTVVIGVYRVGRDTALVGRHVVRASLRGTLPVAVKAGDTVLQCDARCEPGEHLAVLALAVEEDAGRGVKALYAALEDATRVLVYDALDPVPEPAALAHLASRGFTAPSALPVEVLFGTQHAREVCSGDDFVSSSAFVTLAVRRSDTWRLPFADRAGRNDWALVAHVKIT